jgi:hypothetical protein
MIQDKVKGWLQEPHILSEKLTVGQLSRNSPKVKGKVIPVIGCGGP